MWDNNTSKQWWRMVMKKQETFTDIEYSFRKKKTKREEFLEIMDEIIPWDEWVGVIEPYYPKGKRGRPPMGIEKMLRMYLLQIWFNLSDPATEDAIVTGICINNRDEMTVTLLGDLKFTEQI